MEKRYFYHSFPRRWCNLSEEISKGLDVLSAVAKYGLLLTPEYIEWKQPSVDGTSRVLPVMQQRVCFTDLAPSELLEHANKFGHFAIEYDAGILRSLGAIPVFYVPQPSSLSGDASAVGAGLVALVSDASAFINRASIICNLSEGSNPISERIDLNLSYARNPEGAGSYSLHYEESKKCIQALNQGMTPLNILSQGMASVLSMFYPTDDTRHDRLLGYYQQREWRIVAKFAVGGHELMFPLTNKQREELRHIDAEFFNGTVTTDVESFSRLDRTLFYPELNGRKIIQFAHRIIVPREVIAKTEDLLSLHSVKLPVACLEDIS